MRKTIVAIRHAKPEYPSGSLTEEGMAIQNMMSARLKEAGMKPALICHSPLLRAAQTAIILSEYLQAPIVVEPALGEDFNPTLLLARIIAAEENTTLFFVGHEPTLAKFIEELAGEYFLPRGLLKSEAVVLQFDGEITYGQAKLINRYQPE